MSKSLQGNSPKWIKDNISFILSLESYNPTTKEWVPCICINKKLLDTKERLQETLNNEWEHRIKSEYEKSGIVGKYNEGSEEYYEREKFRQKYNEYSSNLDYEQQQEEDRNYYEYRTNDIQKINEIEKKRKEERKATWGTGIIIFFLLFVLPIFIMGMVQKCTGSHYSPFEDNNTEWQYKHTDKHY